MHPQRRAPVKMEDVTLIVRPKGNWSAYRAFTEDQRAEAEAHAREHGVMVETLPLP